MYMNTDVHECVFFCNNLCHVFRLVDPDGSLPDLSMLSASSVNAMLLKEDGETQDKQNMQGGWDVEKEKEQALVVVMDDTDLTDEKPKSLSDPQQSSIEESQQCSANTEPEPSTEQSSGTERHSSNRGIIK